jgi:hypothetical protein
MVNKKQDHLKMNQKTEHFETAHGKNEDPTY